MKCIMGLLFSLTFLLLLAGCSPMEESAAQDINNVSNSKMNGQNDVLSRDYPKAEKAIVKAIQVRDEKTIRLGLKNENFLIKKKAVIALGEIEDKQSVPDLIKVLSENQIVMNGGNEIIVMQADLNRATILALSHITKLTFDISEVVSSDDVNKVIQQSQNWWKNYQKKVSP